MTPLYLVSAHHTCFALEARREEEETYGEVNASHLCSEFIMLTGAWLSPKHNSWWSEEPEVEPQGVRWPTHSFTGSLHRGPETVGFCRQEMRLASFQILAPSRSQRTRTCQEASQWQMFYLTREKLKGPKDVNTGHMLISPSISRSLPKMFKESFLKGLELIKLWRQEIFFLRPHHILKMIGLQIGPLLALRLYELVTFVMMARLPWDALRGPIQVSGVSLDIFSWKTALLSWQLWEKVI